MSNDLQRQVSQKTSKLAWRKRKDREKSQWKDRYSLTLGKFCSSWKFFWGRLCTGYFVSILNTRWSYSLQITYSITHHFIGSTKKRETSSTSPSQCSSVNSDLNGLKTYCTVGKAARERIKIALKFGRHVLQRGLILYHAQVKSYPWGYCIVISVSCQNILSGHL